MKKILALCAALALSVVMAVPASAASHKAFHLDKTCAEDLSEPLQYICTVHHSDFKWIPPETDVHYTAIPPLDPNLVVAATIKIRNGSTTGVCDWRQPAGPVLAICTFATGTGRLTQFHLVVNVTVNSEGVWYWDGWYWFGGGD